MLSRKFIKVVVLCLGIMAATPIWAQVKVSLKLEDSLTGDPAAYATVSLLNSSSNKAYKYALTDANGNVTIESVKNGSYTLKCELMGYKTLSKDIKVEGKDLNLGTLKIEEDKKVLDAASVSAAGNPIIIKKDTIEYNASSFKTSDNDMLEELLKKLPGVEVSSDGTVTANGETISKITIDGKTFFLDDPQLATKNIPAKIIEKVKVVEKKSDQALFTGIDDGEEETVIDLSIYKGMMNGWFGNIMGGIGHDFPDTGYYTDETTWQNDGWRYQGAAMVGNFSDKRQISLIVNANNTNNRGFNDVAGSMMQSMRGSRGMGQGTGGSSNNGITTSWMGGLNGAWTLLDGNMDLSGNYLYNGTKKDILERSSKTTYLDDGSRLIYDNDGDKNGYGYNVTNSQGHRFGVRLDHKFSDNTSILFEPQVNFGSGDFTEYSKFNTTTVSAAGDSTLTNSGFTENIGANQNVSTSGFLLFRQKLGKAGRTLSANINYNLSWNKLDGTNQSLTETEDDTEIVNQRYNQKSNSTSLSARLVYTEPIAKNLFLEANYMYSWNRSTSLKDTYDSGSNGTSGDHLTYTTDGEEYNSAYSSSIINTYQNHQAGANIMYQKEKLRAQVGVSANPTITDNETNGETYHSTVLNWAPQVMFNYEFSDNSNIRLFYNGRSSQPSTSQLMPVADNSDPLNVSFGNPYLEPYFTHSLRAMFGYTNKETFFSLRGHLNGSLVQNTITSAIWYDSAGAQYSMPLNGENSGNASMMLMINSPIARSKFSIFSMTNLSYNSSISYVGKTEGSKGQELIDNYYNASDGTMDYEAFHSDFFGDGATLTFGDYFTDSHTQTTSVTERLRFTYRDDIVEVTIGGRTRMSKSWYSISSYNQSATWNNNVSASMNWTIPGGLGLVTEGNYNWYRGYTTAQEDEIICNIEITKLLFKNKVTLADKAYDKFNQTKNKKLKNKTKLKNEVRNNTLGRYIVVSLTYRFGTFQKGNNRRGGFGGPGGGFGGPPPGMR